MGTAWLVSVDAASGMGQRFADARAIAHEFIEEMQPNDLMDLMFFDDVQVVQRHEVEDVQAARRSWSTALNEFKSTVRRRTGETARSSRRSRR